MPDQALSFFAATAISILGTGSVILTAPKLGWVDAPRADRWHRHPTALLGGIAIFAGIAAPLAYLARTDGEFWILAGLCVVFLGGLWDDRKGLSPKAKVLVQGLAGTLAVFGGAVLDGTGLDPVGTGAVLSVLWFIVCANVVNLVDGMDGVAAGVVAASSMAAALIGWLASDVFLTFLGLVIAGACIGFLVFNRHPARVFMGDCGSLVLGFALAAVSILAANTADNNPLVQLAIMPALLAVPLIDAGFVALIRIAVGRSFSDSGTHHIHHRLGLVGLSEHLVPVVLWGIALVFGLVAAVSWFNVSLFAVLFATSVLCVVLLEILLIEHTGLLPSRGGETAPAEGVKRVASILKALHPWPKVVADAVIFAGALTLGVFLVRGSPLFGVPLWLAVLPVVTAKVALLRLIGIYRRGWFHGYGTPDLIRLVIGVLLGAVVTTIAEFWLFGFTLGARVVLADLALSLLGAVSLRGGYRAARHLLAGQKQSGRRVLLYGAGEAGSLAAKEFRMNRAHGLWPVGFLDDDETKRGAVLYGLRIYGSLATLPGIADALRIDAVVVASGRIGVGRRGDIADQCRALGIDCVELRLYLRDIDVYEPMEPLDVIES